MLGQHPVELGMDEEKFIAIVRDDPRYRRLNPVSMEGIIKAIACFERSIISARSPYDRYHFDRDDSAVSAAAKRGEVVFFSQPFACFTCHGGPNFTSRPNNDGDFKAPTLRNIAITAPYMHDGSVATLEEAIGHRNLPMSVDQKSDLIEFLRTLTDESVLTDPRFAKPVEFYSVEEQDIYDIIGREGFERLVAAFYRQIPSDDVLGPLYPAHDLQGAEQRLRDFLMFRFGGPSTYIETRGHPRLRMRHAPFPIGQAARDHWIQLMNRALDEAAIPEEAREKLRQFFNSTATFLMNRSE